MSGMTVAGGPDMLERHRPQWSPLLVSGMTFITEYRQDSQVTASMEPALGERDDEVLGLTWELTDMASMEPALGERDDVARERGVPPATRASMEPALGERDDVNLRAMAGLGQLASMEPALGERDDVHKGIREWHG